MDVAKNAVFKGFVCCLIGTLLAYLSPIPFAYANPVGGNISAGSATISTSGATETITQKSQNAVIDWSHFNIGGKETTRFIDPNSSSLTVNRVHDMNPSQILGTLSANGNIVLINPNGVFFGQGSKVDVNGIIATTSDVKNSEVMAGGKMHFTPGGNPNASVENEGTITAKDAGLVGLVAPNVQNSGVITAKLGKVQLSSGDSYTLDLYGDKLLEIGVSDAVQQQIVQNTGTIEAEGGTVKLTAAAGRNIVNNLIDVEGEIHAPTFQEHNGTISIYAEGSNSVRNNIAANKGKKQSSSTVTVSGLLDASGYNPGQKGGNISVLGDNVGIMQGGTLDASGDQGGGNIKIGGDFHGAGKTPTAINTLVAHGALIDADAITSGNGGNVAVWSDQFTTFAGRILARGGSESGNGGFVETSGHNLLSLTDSSGNNGMVNASAAKGLAGTWLLDPADVTISTVDSGGGTAPTYIPTGGVAESTINVANINTALNAGTNVSVTTGGDGASGTGGGSITVASNIAKTSGSDATLTLSAATDIIVNSNISISSTTGKLNAVFGANTAGNGGAIVMNSGSSITSNGGNITLGGGTGAISAGSGYAVGDAGNIVGININAATVNAGGGNIIMNGNGYATSTNANYGIEIQGGAKVQTSGTGTIAISGTGGGSGASNSDYGVFATSTNTAVSVVNGNLTITGTSGTTSGTNDYGVDMSNAIVQTTGTGAISATGTSNGTNTTTSANEWGLYGGNISSTATGGGTITISGTSTASNGSAYSNYGVNAPTINSVDGNISISGTSHGTSGNGYGIYSPAVTATGNASITMTGSGSGDGVLTRANISANNGNITITGNDLAGGIGVWNYGVTIRTTGTGGITITGTGGGVNSADNQFGVLNTGIIQVTSASGGNISITGTGGGSGTRQSNYGIKNSGGTISTASTNGTITLTGTGGGGSGGNNYGVEMDSTSIVSSTGSGAISITGVGGSGSNNYGIYTVTGTNTIGGSSDNGNIRFVADTLSLANETITTSSNGSVTFAPYTASTTVGVAGGAGTLQITQAILDAVNAPTVTVGRIDGTGLLTTGAFTWESTLNNLNLESAAAAGSVTLGGNITQSSVANANLNVYAGSDIVQNNAITASGAGNKLNVLFDSAYVASGAGTAGAIVINNSITTNGGNITMGGGSDPTQYGATGDTNHTIGVNLGAAHLQAGGGNIIISGTAYSNSVGGAIGGNGNGYGIFLSGGTIQTTGTGTIKLTGNGAGPGNYEMDIREDTSAVISSVNGDITITGTGSLGNNSSAGLGIFNSGTTIKTTGSGNIFVTAFNNSTNALRIVSTNGLQTTGGGNITANADTLLFQASNSINSAAGVTLAPYTASNTVGVNGAAGIVQYNSGVLADVTAASYTFGNTSVSGLLTAAANIWSAPVSYVTGSGGITISGAQTMGGNSFLANTLGNITLGAGSSVISTASGNAVVLAEGGNFVNNSGSNSPLTAASGRWLVYSTNPANDTAGGLSNDFRRFSCTYSGSCPSFPGTGNGFLYSYAPTLTVTPNGLSINYGDVANLSGYAYSLSGYLGSDLASDSITGSLIGSTNYSQGGSGGTYNINYSSGSLASALGYGFSYANNARGLIVAAAATPPRTLTTAAQTPVQAPVNNPTPVATPAIPVATPATPVVTPATPVTAPSVAPLLPGTVQQETAKTANVTEALMPKPIVPTGSDVQLASYYSLMQLGAIPVTPAPTRSAAPAQAGAPIAATSNGTVTETQAPDGTNAAPGPATDNSVDDHKKKGE